MAGFRVANQQLLEWRKRNMLNEHTARMAGISNVCIFLDPLQGLRITLVQVCSVRYLGFGGKVVAFPRVYLREEWIQDLQNKAMITP